MWNAECFFVRVECRNAGMPECRNAGMPECRNAECGMLVQDAENGEVKFAVLLDTPENYSKQ